MKTEKKLYNGKPLNKENLIEMMKDFCDEYITGNKNCDIFQQTIELIFILKTHYQNVETGCNEDIDCILEILENSKDNNFNLQNVEKILSTNVDDWNCYLMRNMTYWYCIESFEDNTPILLKDNTVLTDILIEDIQTSLSNEFGYETMVKNGQLKLMRNNRQSCIDYLKTYSNESYDFENMSYNELKKERASFQKIYECEKCGRYKYVQDYDEKEHPCEDCS